MLRRLWRYSCIYHLCAPYLTKHGIWDPCAIRTMRVLSTTSQMSVEFVIYMPKNLSTNLCHRLRRLTVSYKGVINLHFDLPSLYSYRTRSPLLWALIRILYLDTARFIEPLYVRSLFSFLGIKEQLAVVNNEIQLLLNLYVHFERLRPGPFN